MSFFSGFKFFGDKDELFDKNGFLIVINIFSDKIFAFTLEKGKEFQVKAYAEESVEGDSRLDFYKIKLNCSKVVAALSLNGFKSSNVVFSFSPEIAQTKFLKKKFARQDSDARISKNEIDGMIALIKNEITKQKESLFFENIERILIDGYVIGDPVGAHGKELELNLLGVSCIEDLKKQFEDLAIFLKLNLKYILSIDKEYLKSIIKKKELKDAIFINIFENTTDIFMIRNGAVVAFDTIKSGYGFLDFKLAEVFQVGAEEAKKIRKSFATGNLDVSIMDKIRQLAVSASEDVLYKTKLSLGLIDKDNLLPPDIFISFFGDYFLQLEQVFSKGNNWFSDLPIPQNANVYFASPKDIQENFLPELAGRQYSYVYAIIYNIIKDK